MKLTLPTVEDLKQFNVRIPERLKAELTQLREHCEQQHLDFNAALAATLQTFAKSLRRELQSRTKAASKPASENGLSPLANPLRTSTDSAAGTASESKKEGALR
jgi:hypothetical protein